MQTALLRAASSPRFDCGTATIARVAGWSARGCVGVIELMTVRGVISGKSWRSVAARAARLERSDHSIAAVVLFESVVFALDAAEMRAAELEQIRAGNLQNPRALVASDSGLPVLRDYALLMAQEGVGRFAFSGAQTAEALGWAQEMGRLMAVFRARAKALPPP